MSDKEKVIKGIECHRKKVQTTNSVSCLECPYSEPKPIREWCMNGLMDDIYALLKEQEAVEPTWQQGKAYCGSCGKRIPLKIGARFCHKCGRLVSWK